MPPPPDLAAFMIQAREALAGRRLDAAIDAAGLALKVEPRCVDAYLVRAEANRRLHKHERALADLAVAIRLAPDRPGPYIVRAEILTRRNIFDQAIADATHALILDPRNASAYSIRARCRNAVGDREGAADDLRAMLEIDPTRAIPDLPAPPSAIDPPPAPRPDDRHWRQAEGGRRLDDPSVLADDRPVDRTYRSRRTVADDDAPEILGATSGYRPEAIPRPLPRLQPPPRRRRVAVRNGGLATLAVGALLGAGVAFWALNRTPEPIAARPARAASPTAHEAPPPPPAPTVIGDAATLPEPLLKLSFDGDDGDKIRENSGVVPTEGIVGKGVRFNGSAFLRVSGSYPSASAPRTMAVWIKGGRGPVEPNVHILNYGPHEPTRSFGIMEAAGRWRFFDWDGGLGTGVAVDQQWRHHAITYDGRTIRYYLDGKPVAETDRELRTIGEPLILGASAPGDANGFVGQLDELLIFDQALDPKRIEAIMSEGAAAGLARSTAESTPAAGAVPDAAPPPSETPPGVYLTDLLRIGLVDHIGWWSDRGEMALGGLNGRPMVRKPLMFQGTRSPRGIFLHAKPSGEASVTYKLARRFKTFRSEAIVPEMLPEQGDPRTPLVFEVRGDGRTLWRSDPLARKGDHRPCAVSVAGVDELSLVVACRGPENWGLAAWIEPRLEDERADVAARAPSPPAHSKTIDILIRGDGSGEFLAGSRTDDLVPGAKVVDSGLTIAGLGGASIDRLDDGRHRIIHDFREGRKFEPLPTPSSGRLDVDSEPGSLVMVPALIPNQDYKLARLEYPRQLRLPLAIRYTVQEFPADGFIGVNAQWPTSVFNVNLHGRASDGGGPRNVEAAWRLDMGRPDEVNGVFDPRNAERPGAKQLFRLPLTAAHLQDRISPALGFRTGAQSRTVVKLLRVEVVAPVVGRLNIAFGTLDGKPDGKMVAKTIMEGAGAKAGVMPGDVVDRINGQEPGALQEAMRRLAAVSVGDPVELTVRREGKTIDLRAIAE